MRYNTQRLDEERVLKGWTRRMLGRFAGVSENMVGQLLNHQVGTPVTAKKITEALGLKMSDILIRDKAS